jgi:hypothetical protein
MGPVAVFMVLYSYSVGSSELYLPVCYLAADSGGYGAGKEPGRYTGSSLQVSLLPNGYDFYAFD